MTKIEQILISRDGLTAKEAHQLLTEAKQMVYEGFDPEEVLMDEFGLEPDYIFDLLD